MELEQTLVLVKPDGVRRRLIGEVIGRLEKKGLRLVGMKFLALSRAQAESHYAPHRERPFYPGLIDFITSGPVVAMVWEGPRAIAHVRNLMGATDPLKADPGSLRGDLAMDVGMNVVHASDATDSAEREISNLFAPGELVTWRLPDEGDLFPEA